MPRAAGAGPRGPDPTAYIDGVQVEPCLNVPYPAFDEERSAGFVMQPGMGVDVNVWRRFTLRLAADLPILASRDYVVT